MNLKLIGIALAASTIFAQAPAPSPSEIWHKLKDVLIGADGDRYFKQQIEGDVIPPFGRFDGKVVSQPSAHELIVNVDDPGGDARLRFPLALKGTIAAGTAVHFQGVARSYTRNPYRLTLDVEDGEIDGLPPGAIPIPGNLK
jgi:hypothetical protein